MFGHTLLRLNPPKGPNSKPDLLAYAVTFAADIQGETNPVAYAFRGLFGDFSGYFHINPYYQLVNEYNHSESRDLWEYDLNLSPEQMEVMTEHIWELNRKAALDYFFLDENCSYHLLSVLEVAQPEWNLVEEFHRHHRLHYVMPAMTVLAVTRLKDAVRAVHFRPSSRKNLKQQYQMLTATERDEVMDVLRDRKKPEDVSNSYSLNALTAYYDYRRYKAGQELSPELRAKLRSTLVQRSKIPVEQTRAVPDLDKDNRPDLAHSPHLFQLFNGWNERGYYLGLGLRQGVHDLLSRTSGYEPNSHLKVLDLAASYYPEEGEVVFTRATLLDLISLDLVSRLEWEKSYRLYLAYEPGLHSSPQKANEAALRGGVGVSANWTTKHIFYLMAIAAGGVNRDVYHGYYLGPGAEAGWVGTLTRNWKLHLTGLWHRPILPSLSEEYFFQSYEFGQSWALSRDFELRLNLQARPKAIEAHKLEHDVAAQALMHF